MQPQVEWPSRDRSGARRTPTARSHTNPSMLKVSADIVPGLQDKVVQVFPASYVKLAAGVEAAPSTAAPVAAAEPAVAAVRGAAAGGVVTARGAAVAVDPVPIQSLAEDLVRLLDGRWRSCLPLQFQSQRADATRSWGFRWWQLRRRTTMRRNKATSHSREVIWL